VTTLNVNTITPAGNTLTLGESGDTVVVADDVKVNTVKDAGGNTLWSSNGSGVISSPRAGIGGADKLLATTTVSSAVANISFTSGIDSSYKEYIFKFINVQPATDDVAFKFNVSDDSSSWTYDLSKTTTAFRAVHTEDNSTALLAYDTGADLPTGGSGAGATDYQYLSGGMGNGADESLSGELHLYNPASTTYVKNFIARTSSYGQQNAEYDSYFAGYVNVTAAVTAIDFKYASGNINAGTIKMYGIS